MNDERSSDLGRRAAVHAALGEPARLRIVDILTLGDASSSELAEALGMPSNLLAHHLNVLREVGLVTGHRSQGDGRRQYLRLVPDALAASDAAVLPVPGRVVFVCTANSARSHLAAALWRHASVVPATSAGTEPAARIDPGARAVASRHGLAMPDVRPRLLDEVDGGLDGADLVVTVCDLAHEELGGRAQLHWSVPDPVRVGTEAAFETAYDELADRVGLLVSHLPPAS